VPRTFFEHRLVREVCTTQMDTKAYCLLLGASIEKALGKKGLNILSKIAGLVLSIIESELV
jgi:small neutral amino acid transporter SnatA (MarC family)